MPGLSILLIPDPVIQSNRGDIASFAKTHRLPLANVGSRRGLPASGLIADGPTRDEYPRLAARYVDQILRGTKRRNLSIEQVTRFELTINLDAATVLRPRRLKSTSQRYIDAGQAQLMCRQEWSLDFGGVLAYPCATIPSDRPAPTTAWRR